jgi:hypothetical protein
MSFQIERGNPALRRRGSRNKNTIVLLALLPDPLCNNPSDAAIQRYAERVDRALARLAATGNAARRRGQFAGDFLLGSLSLGLPQRSKRSGRACKQQAKYKLDRVAAHHAPRPSTARSGRKAADRC